MRPAYWLLSILLLLALPWPVLAIPAFARQTGQPCAACHIGAFGPQLTPFGRQFKLLGYTLKSGSGPEVPLSAMVVESFTRTLKAQTESPAPGFADNDNTELSQASVFLGGRLAEHLGVLAQATYSQNGGLLGWDNMDLRYARSVTHGKHTWIWGVSVNNNPTVSDVFNTAPAWMFPYMSADLAPGAPAQPILFGGLGGAVIGSTAYAQLDNAWYGEVGIYRSLSPAFLRKVNADFGGRLNGLTPYLRLARTWYLASGNLEVGGFAMQARRGLVGSNANGDAIALPGPTDSLSDLGVDASYQYFHGDHTITLAGIYVDERQRLNATYASGGSDHLHDSLESFNLNGSYWYRNTYGATLGMFTDDGSRDMTLYGGSGRPNTEGGIVEFDWNPFGKADSWAEPFMNLRLGAQYIFYTRFSGAVHNIDGAGRSAKDNNTLYVYAWLAI
ncbi:cytochrome C [Dyella sp. A6]|uniref:cytochrome C n=1 Tax=Dyella aluminiiresistens TaxID=3069105 RepID=UPI002E7886A9|nr:cytochrome C [Dyella sp. A6]